MRRAVLRNNVVGLAVLYRFPESHPKDQQTPFQISTRLARASSLASKPFVVRVRADGVDGIIQLQGCVDTYPTLDPRRSTKLKQCM